MHEQLRCAKRTLLTDETSPYTQRFWLLFQEHLALEQVLLVVKVEQGRFV